MATLVVQHAKPSPPHTSALSLDTAKLNSIPLPNKHLPFCSPGPSPAAQIRTPATPPASPPSKHLNIQTFSILHPADNYLKVFDNPPVYSIDASTLASALEHIAAQPLPDPKQVFPWLHGLHPDNQLQLAFFIARRKVLRKTPKCIRGITIIKVDGDLNRSRLKGAIAPEELLSPANSPSCAFLDVDPRDGFSVRNFQIQVAKMAMVSDIVIYGAEASTMEDVHTLAKRVAEARKSWGSKADPSGQAMPGFGTFVVSSPFSEFEQRYPELVAVDSQGQVTAKVIDFFQRERQEMCNMSKASEIADNVWMGPTPDSILCRSALRKEEKSDFDILIEASDLAQLPHSDTLRRIAELSDSALQHIEFPSSGSIMPPTWSPAEVDGLMEMCQWMYRLANPGNSSDPVEDESDSDGDIPMTTLSRRPRKILIHCTDGYTESTLLGLAYFMYAECAPAHDAWLRLHCEKKRNFFSYPSDVALLTAIQSRILRQSPRRPKDLSKIEREAPTWLSRLDGSLPSRILPYMYLGNLGHANNPELLKAMGIRRVLSVGEPVSWSERDLSSWGREKMVFVDRVQDNGVDPLTDEFERCLDFIEKGRFDGTATLVHCRVGVSRSATICIAEVMSSMGLSFPEAYCFVRARRLNVIIQPHLRFAYELLKWEETQLLKRGRPLRRQLEWATIAREIAAMNKPYAR